MSVIRPVERGTHTIRKYFGGKVHIIVVKKELVKKGNMQIIETSEEELVSG